MEDDPADGSMNMHMHCRKFYVNVVMKEVSHTGFLLTDVLLNLKLCNWFVFAATF